MTADNGMRCENLSFGPLSRKDPLLACEDCRDSYRQIHSEMKETDRCAKWGTATVADILMLRLKLAEKRHCIDKGHYEAIRYNEDMVLAIAKDNEDVPFTRYYTSSFRLGDDNLYYYENGISRLKKWMRASRIRY